MRIQHLLRRRINLRTPKMSPSSHVVVEQLEPRLLLDAAFDGLTNLAVGAGPNGVATADLNGDGLADMVVADFNDSTVSVLLALEGGGFASAVPYDTVGPTLDGNKPYGIALGDFKGNDGILDFLVTYPENNSIFLMSGNGDGTFGSPHFIGSINGEQIGQKPQGIVAGHFDGSGSQARLDLAIISKDGNSVLVLYGRAAGNFTKPVEYSMGSSPEGIVAADFNDDGLLDLAVTNVDSNNLTILYGQQSGLNHSFVNADNVPVGNSPQRIDAGDFDNDGRIDLAVVNYLDNDVSILYGLEGGGFGNRIDVAVGTSPRGIVVNDFNEDGRLDFAVTNYGDATVSVVYGLRKGGFGKRADFAVGTQPRGIVTADFNGDQRADLGVSNYLDDNVSVLYGRIIEKVFPLGGTLGYKTVKYQDADDTWVTIKLNGGSATVRITGDDPIETSVYKNVVTVTGDNLKLDSVVLSETTGRHTLSFKTRGGEIPGATIGSISSDQENTAIESLKAIKGKYMDLTGNITIDGKLKYLNLRNVAGPDGHSIKIGEFYSPSSRDKVKIVLGKVADTTVNTHLLPISSLTAIEWLDSDAEDVYGLITAPWIYKITTKGAKKNAKKGIVFSPGDFQADLTLTGPDRGFSLRYAKIAGGISGEWIFDSNVNYIKAGSTTSEFDLKFESADKGYLKKIYARDSLAGSITAKWFGTIQTKGEFDAIVIATGVGARNVSIGRLYAGEVWEAFVDAQGGIKSIKVTEWLNGSISADWIGYLKTSGNRRESIRGDFGADLTLNGIKSPRGLTLKTAKIAGIVVDEWKITGNAGNIQIGTTNNWIATFSGDVKSLKLKGYKLDSGFFIPGNLIGSWTSNSLASGYVTGRIMNAHMTLYRGVDPDKPKLLALGKLTVKGWIGDGQASEAFNTWILTNGNIGTITTGGMVNAAILAFDGATSYETDLQNDGVLDLPLASTVLGDGTVIKKLIVKGLGSVGPYFINSNIAATQFNYIYVAFPDFENSGQTFGLAADYIKKMTIKTPDGTDTFKYLDDSSQNIILGDAEVRLV